MVDKVNLFTSILGLGQVVQGAQLAAISSDLRAQNIIQGGAISALGANLSAEGFRVAAENVRRATGFNLGVQALNDKKRLESISRQFQRTLGAQIATQTRTGLSLGSKSFLAVQNETRDIFERTLFQTKIDAENARRAALFESNVRRVNLENQARAAEYQAQASQAISASQAVAARQGGKTALAGAGIKVARAVPTLLSQIFN
jgi:hypothetical protein